MKKIRELTTKIWNMVKIYSKRILALQDEIIKFNEELKKQYQGDKK